MADSEEKSGLISQFINVSGVSEERAKFYLESASWNLEVGSRFVVLVFIARCGSDRVGKWSCCWMTQR